MSSRSDIDNIVIAQMVAELDKAKEQLVEKFKRRLIEEVEVNEKMRNNKEKLKEQIKIEVEKNARLEADKNTLAEKLATKEEVIKVLTDGANRINNNREKDATIRQLREENAKLIQEQQRQQQQQQDRSSAITPNKKSGTKRRRTETVENTLIESRRLRPRKVCLQFYSSQL